MIRYLILSLIMIFSLTLYGKEHLNKAIYEISYQHVLQPAFVVSVVFKNNNSFKVNYQYYNWGEHTRKIGSRGHDSRQKSLLLMPVDSVKPRVLVDFDVFSFSSYKQNINDDLLSLGNNCYYSRLFHTVVYSKCLEKDSFLYCVNLIVELNENDSIPMPAEYDWLIELGDNLQIVKIKKVCCFYNKYF